MNLKFSIVAEREIEIAADYYENQESGLGALSQRIKSIPGFPGSVVTSVTAIATLRYATLSIPNHLFGAAKHRDGRDRCSSASRSGKMAGVNPRPLAHS